MTLHEIMPFWYSARRYVKDADRDIIAWLKQHGRLVSNETYTHSYPFCWRSDTPLLYKVRHFRIQQACGCMQCTALQYRVPERGSSQCRIRTSMSFLQLSCHASSAWACNAMLHVLMTSFLSSSGPHSPAASAGGAQLVCQSGGCKGAAATTNGQDRMGAIIREGQALWELA